MRILSKVLLSVISVSLLATIAHSKEPEIIRIPQKSDLSCDGAIEAVKRDLTAIPNSNSATRELGG